MKMKKQTPSRNFGGQPEQSFAEVQAALYEQSSKAYLLSPEDAEVKYSTSLSRGISDEEAAIRRQKYGGNVFEKQQKKSGK